MLCENVLAMVVGRAGFPAVLVSRRWRAAARGGHLEVLKWVRVNGCDWDAYTCAWAADGGHLEVLEWARANGCDWDARTCTYAVQRGHLKVLEWARANGCPE